MAETPARILDYIEKCVRCGSCKALCPTYGLRAIEPLSARGRVVLVGALIEGKIKPARLMISRLTSCLLCGMCEGSCPVGVGITDVVYHGLALVAAHDRERAMLRRLMTFALKRPLLCYNAARLMRPALDAVTRRLRIPSPSKGLPNEPFSVGLEIFKPEKPVGRVAVFAGCAVNYMRPDLGRLLVRALFKLGYEVVLPSKEACCGAPLRAFGQEGEARRMAEKNLEAFGMLNAEAVLSLCPTCTLALRKQYRDLCGQGLENAMDATEFLSTRVVGSGMKAAREFKGKSIVYHAPCHLQYGLGVKDAPIDFLRGVGLEVNKPPVHSCCGFNQNMADREMAGGLLQERCLAYEGFDVTMSSCPGCVEQLSRGLPAVRHVIEALDLPGKT